MNSKVFTNPNTKDMAIVSAFIHDNDSFGIAEGLDLFNSRTETTVQVISEILSAMNYGRRNSVVDNCSHFYVADIEIDKIRIKAKNHFNQVKGRHPVSVRGDDFVVDGIVVVDDRDGFFLVDGYHRMKWNLEHYDKRKMGRFIVLST